MHSIQWSAVISRSNIVRYYIMMTSSNGNIFRVTGPLCGEFTGPGEFPTQRPVTRSFDVFLDLRLNKRLSKQPRGWWFKTQSWSLWRHCNVKNYRNWDRISISSWIHKRHHIPRLNGRAMGWLFWIVVKKWWHYNGTALYNIKPFIGM